MNLEEGCQGDEIRLKKTGSLYYYGVKVNLEEGCQGDEIREQYLGEVNELLSIWRRV